MKKGRKILCLVIALTFALTIALTGCGNQASTQQATASSAETVAEASTKAVLPPVELSWYIPMNAQKEVPLVETALDDYLKDKINATIKLNFVDWGSWSDKSQVMIAAGDPMDIMFTAGWSNYRQNVAKGAFVDITDLMQKYCPNTLKVLNKRFIEGSKIDGRNYAIPTQKELAREYGIQYNVELAKKYNFDMSKVKRWKDLEPMLETIKEKEGFAPILSGYGTEDNIQRFMNLDPVGDLNTPGKLLPDGSTKVVNQYELPEAKQWYQVVRDWYLKGYIPKDVLNIKDATPIAKSGKWFVADATLRPLVEEDVSMGWGVPVAQIGFQKPYISGSDTQGSMQAISKTSDNVERALMFLELVNTDKFVNNTLNYGVEGKHYVKVSDNVVDFAPGLDAKTSGYYPSGFWEFGNQYLNYFMKGQNTKKWELFDEFNNSATASAILGFQFDQEPVKTEIAASANVQTQYNPILNAGVQDVDTVLPKYLDALKGAGVDKIIAEKQKQIDAWLAANKK